MIEQEAVVLSTVGDVDRDGVPDAGEPTVSIDMSDLLMYLHHHSVVSGIQRVIAEVLPFIDARTSCQLVAFSPERGEFVVLDKPAMMALLQHVRHANDDQTAYTRGLVAGVKDSIAGRPALTVTPGDVLGLLGAAWVYESMFQAVAGLKAGGAAVVVLLYDLIPVVFPGFAEAMVLQFRQYLPKVAALADRAPAISASTRRDFERYCRTRSWSFPPGGVTRLAADQWSEQRMAELGGIDGPPWPRPYVLMVSTVESRKNHILALRCWAQLLAELGPDAVPDLVCVGRIGWNVFEFLSEFSETAGLGGKIHLLSEAVSDAMLTALYRDCLFTVYPSRYEGWGLPITESLSVGKPVVCARNTSLAEAGGDFVTYFADDDLDGFHDAVAAYLLDPDLLARDGLRIRSEYQPLGWADVAEVLLAEFELARTNRRRINRTVNVGTEYGLMAVRGFDDGLEGIPYLRFLDSQCRLPMTGQVMGVGRAVTADIAVSGTGLTRTFTGRNVAAGGRLVLEFARPALADPHLVLALGHDGEPVRLQLWGPLGPVEVGARPGETVRLALGTGVPGEVVRVTVRNAAGSTGAAFCVASFTVLESAAAAIELGNRVLLVLLAEQQQELERQAAGVPVPDEQAAAALAEVLSSTSWRVTQPLRAAVEKARRFRHA